MKALPHTRRSVLLACVLLVHGAALWALQHGLMQRVVDTITPAQVLTEISLLDAAPSPRAPATVAPAPQRPTAAHQSTPVAVARRAATPTLPTPPSTASAQPLAVASAAPAETAPASAHSTATPAAASALPSNAAPGLPASARIASAASALSGAASAQAATAAATPSVQLPSSEADYLHNPKPAYPALSRRLGEQGRVVVRTLIGADGLPQQAEVLRSSGFERLDRAAVDTAMRWRFVPGKRAGVAEAMWFNLPLHFVLD